MLTFDQLKEASGRRERTVMIPQLNDTVRLKLFTKKQIDEMRAEAVVNGEVNNEKFEQLLFMRGLIEPAVTEEQYRELYEGTAGIYYTILMAIMEGNGLTAFAQREARRQFQAES